MGHPASWTRVFRSNTAWLWLFASWYYATNPFSRGQEAWYLDWTDVFGRQDSTDGNVISIVHLYGVQIQAEASHQYGHSRSDTDASFGSMAAWEGSVSRAGRQRLSNVRFRNGVLGHFSIEGLPLVSRIFYFHHWKIKSTNLARLKTWWRWDTRLYEPISQYSVSMYRSRSFSSMIC